MKALTLITIMIFVLFGCGRTHTKTEYVGCSVEDTPKGAVVTCPDGTEVPVYDGEDGENGSDGKDGEDGEDAPVSDTTIVDILDPCGDDPDHYDEVLLITQGGSVIAYFREGKNHEFLSLLVPGDYETTDKQECEFTVNPDYSVTW